MKENDARQLDRQSQETLRIRGVKAVRLGMKPKEVAKLLDVSRRTVDEWMTRLCLKSCPFGKRGFFIKEGRLLRGV